MIMKNAEPIQKLHCVVCGYNWWPKSPKPPICCARCRRADWIDGKGPRSIKAAKLRLAIKNGLKKG
jgi:endogenous inhibitor of DNA gyrase (YacG/DUF329 family)